MTRRATPRRVLLRKGREKAARNRHPWVFSGAVERVAGEGEPGEPGELIDAEGSFVAHGFVNPGSQIVFRSVSFEASRAIDSGLIRERLTRALALRQELFGEETAMLRLVNAEGDGLPGLTLDRYGDVLVMRVTSAGLERFKGEVTAALVEELSPRLLYERSDGRSRRDERLEPAVGALHGEAPAGPVEASEAGLRFLVDVARGQKTGFYLDQRESRQRLRELASGRSVLDLFSYTGGFALNALAGGARHVVAVNRQEAVLETLGEQVLLNGLDASRLERQAADAFTFLREADERFDAIVVDPPPFARRRSEVNGACRGYKELLREAYRLSTPGGLLLISSCSHHISPWLFQQLAFQAAEEAGRMVQILGRWGQPADHPFLAAHPEGEYLKTFLLRVSE